MKYKLIAAGGTFDHLHDGHKAFLAWLFSQGENVLLGITTDTFATQTKISTIEPFVTRKQTIEGFLQSEGLLQKVEIIPIESIYGPLLDKTISPDAIAVTEDTYKGADVVNRKRQEAGLSPLPIVSMPLVKFSKIVISSTAIRNGKINEKGEGWVKEEWQKSDYNLPPFLRGELRKPFGKILSSIPKTIQIQKIITVGDVTTKLFNSNGLFSHLAIIDFVIERKQAYQELNELGFDSSIKSTQLKNPPGSIASDAWEFIEQGMLSPRRSVIQVEGEEDLLVLPCILLAPLGCHIFYGQPHVGLVDVEVTLEIKKRAFDLMSVFTVREL